MRGIVAEQLRKEKRFQVNSPGSALYHLLWFNIAVLAGELGWEWEWEQVVAVKVSARLPARLIPPAAALICLRAYFAGYLLAAVDFFVYGHLLDSCAYLYLTFLTGGFSEDGLACHTGKDQIIYK